MPIYVQSSRATGEDAVCIPMELTGWRQFEGQTAAVGRRLDCDHVGATIAVVLTTRDKNSQNRKRPTLEEWRQGFRAFNEHFQLDIGGIVSFKDCRRVGNGVYVSAWPNVLASNRDQVKNVVRAQYVLMRATVRPDGTGWGDVVVFYPEEAAQCETEASVADHTVRLAGAMNVQAPLFVLRALNRSDEVLAATHVTPKYTRRLDGGREIYVAPTPNEIGLLARAYASELRKLSTHVAAFNVLPADRFPLSSHTMLGADRIKATEVLTKGFREKDASNQEIYVAKEALMKVSAAANDSGGIRFVNGVYPVKRFGRGSNPDLLGGLVYASNAVFEPVRLANSHSAQGARSQERSVTQEQGVVPRVSAALSADSGSYAVASADTVPGQGSGASSNRVPQERDPIDDPFAGVPSAPRRRPSM